MEIGDRPSGIGLARSRLAFIKALKFSNDLRGNADSLAGAACCTRQQHSNHDDEHVHRELPTRRSYRSRIPNSIELIASF